MAEVFRQAGIESADIDARLLICAAAGIDHAGLIRDPDVSLGVAAAVLTTFGLRRLQREPVSRILGRREFWGQSFAVDASVLDPRPETEGLVASVRDALGGCRDQMLSILDLGTGSGVILAALLHELPRARGIGIDRSVAACSTARRNLSALGFGARAAIVCGDWAAALKGRFDVVASNPPYIATKALATLDVDVRDHDPLAALDGGVDGFDAYRAIVPCLPDLLCPGGVAAFECGAGQGTVLSTMLGAQGLVAPAVYRDLAGHDRVVLALKAS